MKIIIFFVIVALCLALVLGDDSQAPSEAEDTDSGGVRSRGLKKTSSSKKNRNSGFNASPRFGAIKDKILDLVILEKLPEEDSEESEDGGAEKRGYFGQSFGNSKLKKANNWSNKAKNNFAPKSLSKKHKNDGFNANLRFGPIGDKIIEKGEELLPGADSEEGEDGGAEKRGYFGQSFGNSKIKKANNWSYKAKNNFAPKSLFKKDKNDGFNANLRFGPIVDKIIEKGEELLPGADSEESEDGGEEKRGYSGQSFGNSKIKKANNWSNKAKNNFAPKSLSKKHKNDGFNANLRFGPIGDKIIEKGEELLPGADSEEGEDGGAEKRNFGLINKAKNNLRSSVVG